MAKIKSEAKAEILREADSAGETAVEFEESLVGTAEDVQAMMEKFDRESNTRHFSGVPRKIARYCLVAFSLFCVYMNMIAIWDERTRRASFVGLLILLAFSLYPARKHGNREKRINHIPVSYTHLDVYKRQARCRWFQSAWITMKSPWPIFIWRQPRP